MQTKQRRTKLIFNFVFLLLIAGGIYFILKSGDIEKLKDIGKNLDYFGLVGVLAITVLNVLLIIYRWFLLLKPVKNGISFGNVFYISISAVAVDFTGPGKLGMPTKAVLLKKMEGVEISKSIPSLMSELILEYSIAAFLMLAAALVGSYLTVVIESFHKYLIELNYTIIFVFLATIILLAFMLRKKVISTQFFKNIVVALKESGRRKDVLAAAAGITVLNYLLTFAADVWLYKSIGFDIPYIFIVFSGCFAHFMALFSPLPGGLGMREVSSAYMFKVFYKLGEVSVIAVLIRRILTYLALFMLFVSEKVINHAIRKQTDTPGQAPELVEGGERIAETSISSEMEQ
ncbi:flippase-like domain-containing protein [candidate division KSB1 bacterium]|nr:flippase-like domain-containing protein [candidate division KSB1 bacterium]